MPYSTDILVPINTNGVSQFDAAQMVSNISSGLVYDVSQYAAIRAQISTPRPQASSASRAATTTRPGARCRRVRWSTPRSD